MEHVIFFEMYLTLFYSALGIFCIKSAILLAQFVHKVISIYF